MYYSFVPGRYLSRGSNMKNDVFCPKVHGFGILFGAVEPILQISLQLPLRNDILGLIPPIGQPVSHQSIPLIVYLPLILQSFAKL